MLGQLIRFGIAGGDFDRDLCGRLSAAGRSCAGARPGRSRGAVRLRWSPPPSASCCTARWSFKGHGTRDHSGRQHVKFLLVQGFGLLLNMAFTWVITGPLLHGPTWVPLVPAVLVMPARHLRAQPPMGVRLMADLMDRIVYDRMAAHDSTHWWYRARRDILADYLAREGNLPKQMRASSRSAAAPGTICRCSARSARSTRSRSTPPRAPSPASGSASRSAPRRCPSCPGSSAAAYDLIAVLDVVEHIEDDVAALKAMAGCLKPGGKILITVPAHQWMWSAHDVVNHHHRRYSKATLAAAIDAAGLERTRLALFQLAAVPARRRRAARRAADRQGRQRRFAAAQAAQRAVRGDLPRSSATWSAGCRCRRACRSSRWRRGIRPTVTQRGWAHAAKPLMSARAGEPSMSWTPSSAL